MAQNKVNRGAGPERVQSPGGKFDSPSELRHLERLHRRNEFLIGSHHSMRETLMLQTGDSEPSRRSFLGTADESTVRLLIHRCRPAHEREPAFRPDADLYRLANHIASSTVCGIALVEMGSAG